MKPIVELRNVTKVIRGKKIIDHLSLNVNAGEVFGLLGPNGAGKTTTIRMMAGLIRISSGDIFIDGKNIEKDYENAIQQVGAIVENPEPYKFLTGYQNLQQAARLAKGVTKEKIDHAVELVGLTERIHDKAKTYSLGMRQRLGIAVSLLHDPKVLILDEPTNGLDPAGIREVRDYIRTLAKERGLAVIVSSHLLSEMEMMCDRIAVIQNGTLIDVQHVANEADSGKCTYVCDIHDPVEALRLLRAKGVEAVKDPEGIRLVLDKHEISDLLRLFLDHGLHVFELRKWSKSLEDRFFEMTESEMKKHA